MFTSPVPPTIVLFDAGSDIIGTSRGLSGVTVVTTAVGASGDRVEGKENLDGVDDDTSEDGIEDGPSDRTRDGEEDASEDDMVDGTSDGFED